MTVRELIAAMEVAPDQDAEVVVDIVTRRRTGVFEVERVTVVSRRGVVLTVDAR